MKNARSRSTLPKLKSGQQAGGTGSKEHLLAQIAKVKALRPPPLQALVVAKPPLKVGS
jgi:hypothetical protein